MGEVVAPGQGRRQHLEVETRVAVSTVLIPGLTCDATFWSHQRVALEPYVNVVIPRLHEFDSFDAMARSILTETAGQLDVVGHSMGGRVALEISRLAPERVRSLALLDTGSHGVTDSEPASRQVRLDIAQRDGMAGVALDWVPMMIDPARHNDHRLIEAITAMVTSYTVEQFTNQIRALLTRRDAGPDLGAIRCPTLVACGRADSWSPVEQHVELAARIPAACLEIIEDAGHMIAMERPEATTDMLLRWLRSI